MIKDYPPYRLARLRSAEDTPNRMFMPLFNHIKRNDIPMTAPVEMGYSDSSSPPPGDESQPTQQGSARSSTESGRAESMAFLYRAPDVGRLGPDAADSRIVVEDVRSMTVLSISIRGNYTEANFRKALGTLRKWIQDNPGRVRIVGAPRYLAYNSPFVPGFLKLGEVQLPVCRLAPTTRPSGSS